MRFLGLALTVYGLAAPIATKKIPISSHIPVYDKKIKKLKLLNICDIVCVVMFSGVCVFFFFLRTPSPPG